MCVCLCVCKEKELVEEGEEMITTQFSRYNSPCTMFPRSIPEVIGNHISTWILFGYSYEKCFSPSIEFLV